MRIFLAGDSTMAEKRPEKRPESGWGEALQSFFDSTRVQVVNHARNGRSTRSFIEEGRWDALLSEVRRGDYVFIQFGHNDQSKEKVDRYTPSDAYRENLTRFVSDVRKLEAHPVLLTPVVRRRFNKAGEFYDVHGVYPDLVRAVAKECSVPLLDMHKKSEELLTSLGSDESKELFLHLEPGVHPNYPEGLRDDTHFSPRGAEEMARIAAELLRSKVQRLRSKVQGPKPKVQGPRSKVQGPRLAHP